jgi:hypothetical protein
LIEWLSLRALHLRLTVAYQRDQATARSPAPIFRGICMPSAPAAEPVFENRDRHVEQEEMLPQLRRVRSAQLLANRRYKVTGRSVAYFFHKAEVASIGLT